MVIIASINGSRNANLQYDFVFLIQSIQFHKHRLYSQHRLYEKTLFNATQCAQMIRFTKYLKKPHRWLYKNPRLAIKKSENLLGEPRV